MILNKFIEVKISRKNIDHYIKFYKDIKLGDTIKVNPNNLQKFCTIKIDVSCDICGIERNIKFLAYTKNINSCPEHPIYTCDKCSHIKIKEYNKKKWGVEYYSQTTEYTEKFKNTMIERWGVEYAQQSPVLREKTKKTNLENFGVENPFMDNKMIKKKFKEKWGVEHPSKLKSILEKTKARNIEKWGVDHHSKTYEHKVKVKETNIQKWGVDHYSKTDDFIIKIKETNNKKWGVDWVLQHESVKEKSRKTSLEKWGTTNPILSDEARKRFKITGDSNYISYEGSGISKLWCEQGHIYMINTSHYSNRTKNNTTICTVCHPIGTSRSIKEDDVYNFITNIYNGEVIQSYRNGLEIDIYLPELKLGFEFNGLYWHSEKYKSKDYHRNKTDYFNELGIRIVHIWEDDWDYKSDILKSQIANLLGYSEKIMARKCTVRNIDISYISSNFLNENHIQGTDKSAIKLGLFNGELLVSVMTFNKLEGRTKMEEGGWNLSRFCNLSGWSIVGAASKLLSYFIREYKPKRIVSYADYNWSIGNLYDKLGFSLVSISKPDYKYLYEDKRVHKSNFSKRKMKFSVTENGYLSCMGLW
jgi:hypothetical protein